ncbi:hypothetical protein QA596_10440 [Balneolales bacterium ANBcel1]|nr:hypothetical protein [Balneolales bacterium ANBcel1]
MKQHIPIPEFRRKLVFGSATKALAWVPVSLLLVLMCMQTAYSSEPLLAGETRFSRQLDAMRWHYFGNLAISEGNFRLQLDNTFTSRLFLSDGEARNIQDENRMNLNLRQWINDGWALDGEVRSYNFSTTDLRQDMGHIGILFNPHEEIELSAMGGVMSDQRGDRLDQGWSGLFRARSRPFTVGDFTFHPGAEAHYARISPREYSVFRLHSDNRYRLDNFVMQADVTLSSGRRESYQPSSFFNRDLTNIIESIRSDTTALDLNIRVPITDEAGLTINLYTLSNTRYVESRPIEDEVEGNIFDTRTQRQEVMLRSAMDYRLGRSRLSAGFNFGYINRGSRLINTESFPEDQITRRNEILRNSNFDQSRLEVFTQNRFRLSDRNEVTIRAQSGILRYDTPEINQDDRDELSHQLLITTRHLFSPHFDLTVRAGGEATHYVYLSAARSMENNWRRSIRLAPSIRWQPFRRLEIRQSLLVRANYTVEDFEIEGRPKNDQSSREHAMQTAVDLALTDGWRVEMNGSRSELRVGRLFWDTFEEMPTDTLITYDSNLMIVRETGRHRIGVGGRFFMRRDYLPQATLTTEIPNQDGVMIPVSRTSPGLQVSRQLGPSVDIDLHFSSGNRLVVRGWLQRQRVRRTLYTTYDEEIRDAFRREERRTTGRTYPNLEIRAIFAF